MLSENIKKLVEYGISTGLMPECEKVYTTNLLLDLFHLNLLFYSTLALNALQNSSYHWSKA